MEVISVIAMLFLSLFGYSGGITAKAGNKAVIQPILPDIVMVIVIWAVIITLKVTLDINRWFYLLIGLGLGIVAGYFIALLRKFEVDKYASQEEAKSRNLFKNIWKAWMGFSKRIGHFQNRVFIALFFLTLAAPVALLVRLFSDPLNIKNKSESSHWTATKENLVEMEDFRRQF
ncbi:MAG: hypothetical protein JW712_07700 [Dehalococcoidales bacterium]|nr:hypothetical protein [Dehalococcoidales bacterium]